MLVKDVERGVTPTAIEVTESTVIRLEKEGYKPAELSVTRRINRKWIVLDILCGVFPLVVDALTGKWYELSPHAFETTLQPIETSRP